jgi:signal transduction histidine kinase
MLYAREKRIEMKFNTLLRNKVIAIDEEKYERILLNLLSNAIKYTPPGKLIYINMSKVKDRICVEVKDEGMGIPLRDQDIIFEKYRQVDNCMLKDSQGTGIGLSLVKKLVNVLGGEITVESEEGKGSSFKVYFNETLIDEEESPQVSDWTFDDGQLEHQISIEFSDIFIEEKKKEPASQI